ncbi:hypothetical protein PoB_003920500 [Plakobranchus ocellatus]|uniref:Secreted protein n=1 Tax=Plakobranchus ocellatus TaxID=259542 RepID=A0AAV4AWF9_9GAST|nr:hypothetical protein PoB_003920500 [Plakobranchus ocellatus]
MLCMIALTNWTVSMTYRASCCISLIFLMLSLQPSGHWSLSLGLLLANRLARDHPDCMEPIHNKMTSGIHALIRPDSNPEQRNPCRINTLASPSPLPTSPPSRHLPPVSDASNMFLPLSNNK